MRFYLPAPVDRDWYPQLKHVVDTYSMLDVEIFLTGAVEETIVGMSGDHSAFYRAAVEQIQEDYEQSLEADMSSACMEESEYDRLRSQFYNELEVLTNNLLSYYQRFKPYLPTTIHDMIDFNFLHGDTLCLDIFGDPPCNSLTYQPLSQQKTV